MAFKVGDGAVARVFNGLKTSVLGKFPNRAVLRPNIGKIAGRAPYDTGQRLPKNGEGTVDIGDAVVVAIVPHGHPVVPDQEGRVPTGVPIDIVDIRCLAG